MYTELMMPSNHLIFSHPLPSCPQSFPASGSFPMSQLFASGGQSIGASASVSVLPMNIQGWIPFKTDWFNLPAVQGTLKSLLQHHRLKASILQHPAIFMFQLSHPYMTTGKTLLYGPLSLPYIYIESTFILYKKYIYTKPLLYRPILYILYMKSLYYMDLCQ